ncbi:ester cyclase [Phycicoccus sp. M110.8]|uniref:ester cyclase n=1 Tax=Phycicoccus sp. M110.8 TaxID=3075433 RepID=UPI0028FD0AF1|nr:ester cyclase [Phycicoccus sp. M110.8]MDU0312870.1 ester cyclase [Phycicoccus sp. M110.8]
MTTTTTDTTSTRPSPAPASPSTATATAPDPAAVMVLRRIFDEGFATGDGAVVDELCSPDLVEHQFGMAGRGAEALDHLREAMAQVHAAMPDIAFTIEDAVQSGDTLWARVTGRGTATDPFFGPPSGRPVEITVIDVVRVVDGRIVEHWGVPDRFALLAQTGVLDRLQA